MASKLLKSAGLEPVLSHTENSWIATFDEYGLVMIDIKSGVNQIRYHFSNTQTKLILNVIGM